MNLVKYLFWIFALVLAASAWLWFGGNEDSAGLPPAEESPATAVVKGEDPLPEAKPSAAPGVPALGGVPSAPPDAGAQTRAGQEVPASSPYVVDSLGVLRDPRGGLATMRQEAAAMACKERGMRLPTIRELVTWGNQLAAARNEISGRTRPELITALNPDGKLEEFTVHYDSSGHGDSFPQEDWGRKWFFSSSRGAHNPEEYYSLSMASGYVSRGENPDPESRSLAVRCVPEDPQPRQIPRSP